MWGLTSIKTACRNITDYLRSPKKAATKTVAKITTMKWIARGIGLLRIISSAGQTLFGTQKLYLYVRRSQNPWDIPGIIVASFLGICNICVTWVTKVPAIDRKLRPADAMPKKPEKIKPIIEVNKIEPKNIDVSEFGLKAKTIYHILRAMGLISGFFASMSVFLGSIVLEEYCAQLLWHMKAIDDPDIHNTDARELTTQLIALLLFFAQYISYLSYNFDEYDNCARLFCYYIDQGEINEKASVWLNSRAGRITIVGSLFSVLSAPAAGFFSTINALDRIIIPYAHVVVPTGITRYAISGLSAFTFFMSYFFTQIPALYGWLNTLENIKPAGYRERITWEPYVDKVTYTTGFFDSLGTGANNFMGVVTTTTDVLGEKLNFDMYNFWLMFAAGVSALSASGLYMAFGIHRAYSLYKNDVHEMSGHHSLEEVTNNDLENGDAKKTASEITEANEEEAEDATLIKRDTAQHYTNGYHGNGLFGRKPPQAGNAASVEKPTRDCTIV